MVWKIIGLSTILFASIFLWLWQKPKAPSGKIENVGHENAGQIRPKPQFTPESVSLEKIFGENHEWVATLSAEKVRTLIATGDVIPARSVNYQTVSRNNFKWPFEKTAEIIKNADITFINLESPLVGDCPLTNEGMIFCGDSRHLEGLVYGGVDVVSLANNHAGDYGGEGIEETTNLLDSVGILATGKSGPVFKDIRDLRFAFLGYNDIDQKKEGISWVDKDKISKEVREARNKSDIVVATFHWGTEYVSQPTERQRELAHLAIDAGADLVIGNHPHWIQPVEIYKGKVIVYAHGNFIFDQMWSPETKEGIVGRYTFYDKNLVDVEFLPIEIKDFGQPYFLEGEKKRAILEEMQNQSFLLAPLKPAQGRVLRLAPSSLTGSLLARLEIENFGQPYFLEGEKKRAILEEMQNQSFLLAPFKPAQGRVLKLAKLRSSV